VHSVEEVLGYLAESTAGLIAGADGLPMLMRGAVRHPPGQPVPHGPPAPQTTPGRVVSAALLPARCRHRTRARTVARKALL
jgi:hypothetical protein